MIGASCTSGQRKDFHVSHATRPPSAHTRSLSTVRAATSTLASEIGFDDTLVALDRAGWAFRDLVAVIEHEDGLAETHHDFTVVLDEQDRLAGVAEAADRVEE